MRHYGLFTLRAVGVVLSVLVVIGLIVAGVLGIGSYQHDDYGTANKVSGDAAGLVNWHDGLVVMLNKEVKSDNASYKSTFAWGYNSYSFFNHHQPGTRSACAPGQGFVNATGILESRLYYGSNLLDHVRDVLNFHGYHFTEVSGHRSTNDDEHILYVTNGTYTTEVDIQASAGKQPLGNWIGVTTYRTDKKYLCYPIGSLPAPQGPYHG